MGAFRREREIERLRERLERFGWPRLRMLLIVALTGAVGFIASFVLLHAGVASMPLRYAIAVLIAYAMFLVLLWLWLRSPNDNGVENLDIPDFSSTQSGGARYASGGGDPASVDHDHSGLFEGFSADESVIPLLLIVAVAVVLFASLWIVASAPTLFAELLLDGALAAGLYRHLRGLETRHWLDTALRRTAIPFAATALTLIVFGFAAQHYAPGAHSIGEVMQRAKAQSAE